MPHITSFDSMPDTVHIMGIAGTAMAALAGMLHDAGITVTPAPRKTAAPTRRPPRRKRKPGELWENLRPWLAQRPDGATLDEMVEVATANDWTAAHNVAHAVKICMGRLGDQVVSVAHHKWALPTERPAPATVRVRKKVDRPANGQNPPDFTASAHYPRRSRRA